METTSFLFLLLYKNVNEMLSNNFSPKWVRIHDKNVIFNTPTLFYG